MTRLYHPQLNRWIVRSERQARVLVGSGWQRVNDGDEVSEAKFFAAAAGLEDTDVGGEAPAEQDPTPDNPEE